MNDRRESAETANGSIPRIIAALEAADRKLAEHLSGDSKTNAAALIADVRLLLRSAMTALTASSSMEAGEDPSPAKRRVKIKAEGAVAPSNETARAVGASAKSGAVPAKSAARSARGQDGPRAARRAAAAEKAAAGSLLARLGAATEIAGVPPAQAEPPPASGAAPVVKTDLPVNDAVARLARLEAEIADLTEAVTAVPAVPASASPSSAGSAQPALDETRTAGSPPASAAPDTPDVGTEDDEDAEITIIGADGAPKEPAPYSARQTSRTFREGPPRLEEEEAEVEIRGQIPAPAAGRGAARSGPVRISARTGPGARPGGALGKWRLFRGSN
ncbi:MAG: hypothetical protein ACK4TL_14165 [Hyphomicrobiaceae bacterium]